MRTLIVGQGGRESALAWRMAESSELCAFMAHKNPSIIQSVESTGGQWAVGNVLDPQAVAAYAEAKKVDMVMVSADDPLAAGVIDAIQSKNIRCVGPTKAGAEIEWNKTFGRRLLEEVAPEVNPFYRVARTHTEIDAIFSETGEMPVAVKPVGLTGGKGVKVMGAHLEDVTAAKAYAREILDAGIGGGTAVIVEEKVVGAEFTIQAITDGKTIIFPPATYDYPYRYANDQGPGTGGMGSYCVQSNGLPFMDVKYYDKAVSIIEKVVDKLDKMGRHFNGALNSGFFITNKGDLKVIEFNARFGDPECMNIMMILDSDWTKVMDAIASKSLRQSDIKFKNNCSSVVYLVSPDYALDREQGVPHQFQLNVPEIQAMGCHVFFASSEKLPSSDNRFQTIGTSRCVGIGAVSKDLEDARSLINNAITRHMRGPLEWRSDIGSQDDIERIKHIIRRPLAAPSL